MLMYHSLLVMCPGGVDVDVDVSLSTCDVSRRC